MKNFALALMALSVSAEAVAEKNESSNEIVADNAEAQADSENLVYFQQPYAHYGFSAAHHAGDRLDAHRSFEAICEENGFAFEVHEVTTEDGYVLNVFRIPGYISEQVHGSVYYHGSHNVAKPPVFMQHGIFDSAYSWVVNYADIAPAFVAARAGYDVWLGNSRGNTYSRHHTHLDADHHDKAFWDFSWQDMGKYDLPAVINMIQHMTGGQKVAYVGHQQGTTQMFSAMTQNPAYYDDKLSLFVALSPMSKVPHAGAALFSVVNHFYDTLVDTANALGIHEIGGAQWFTHGVSSLFCSHTHAAHFCDAIRTLFTNHHAAINDVDRFDVYSGHSPNGVSLKDILHYTQNQREARFQVFADDYKSFFYHHQPRTTDLLPLEHATGVPIAMYAGVYDVLGDVIDARWTRDMLHANVIRYQELEADHMTFLVGKDMSYWTHDVMGLLHHYHPLPHATYHHAQSYYFLQ